MKPHGSRAWRFAILVLAAAVLATACGTWAAASSSRDAGRSRTLYAVVTRAQFVNIADGITRGDLTNPLNSDSHVLPPPKASSRGPLPGDTALYSFKLYVSPTLHTRVGSGTYTCTYGFHDHGICEGYFDLGDGTIFASGGVSFASSGFSLAITGGTSAYIGASGELVAAPLGGAGKTNESRLDFVLES